jgi:hypothetical protein
MTEHWNLTMLDEPMALSTNLQIIMAHYNQYWGMATEVLRFAFSDAPHDAPFIAEFFIGAEDEPLYVYATLGMSEAPSSSKRDIPNARQYEHIELFMYANQPSTALKQSLALLATYPFQMNAPLAPLDTVYGSHSIVEGSQLTSVLLSLPLREPEEFAAVDVGDYLVHLLMVTPITEAERQFAIKQGALALLELFAQEQVDVADLKRQGISMEV